MFKKSLRAFTLIELLVVIAIIAILAVLIIIRIGSAVKESRDSRRLRDMAQIQEALEIYKIKYGKFPPMTDFEFVDGIYECGTWDVSNNGDGDTFIDKLVQYNIMSDTPRDPISGSTTPYCEGYRFFKYNAGDWGCPVERGGFYVLGVTNMETVQSGQLHSQNPGFSCPPGCTIGVDCVRDWQTGFEWVTGVFEN